MVNFQPGDAAKIWNADRLRIAIKLSEPRITHIRPLCLLFFNKKRPIVKETESSIKTDPAMKKYFPDISAT